MPGSSLSFSQPSRVSCWLGVERRIARQLPPSPPFQGLLLLDHAEDLGVGKDKTAIFFHLVYGLLLLSLLFWSCSFSYSLLVCWLQLQKGKKTSKKKKTNCRILQSSPFQGLLLLDHAEDLGQGTHLSEHLSFSYLSWAVGFNLQHRKGEGRREPSSHLLPAIDFWIINCWI